MKMKYDVKYYETRFDSNQLYFYNLKEKTKLQIKFNLTQSL